MVSIADLRRRTSILETVIIVSVAGFQIVSASVATRHSSHKRYTRSRLLGPVFLPLSQVEI